MHQNEFEHLDFYWPPPKKIMKNGRKMELFTTKILFVLTHEGTCSRIQLETGDSRN